MLYIVVADQITPLAAHLAKVLSVPLDDAFSKEWIAVPTIGMQRWLGLELARNLGSSSTGLHDGIASNLGMTFPGTLRRTLLTPPSDTEVDLWDVDRLVWTTFVVLWREQNNPELAAITDLPDGVTWYSRARQIADLFDRYSVRRPTLLRHWLFGDDLDGTDRPVGIGDKWQPVLWRMIRSEIDRENAAELLPVILDKLRNNELASDLPSRLVFFGLTTLPNGSEFLDLVDAVAQQRDVYLYLADPSLPAGVTVDQGSSSLPHDLYRDHQLYEIDSFHPLLYSWGRPYRERALLLKIARSEGRIQPEVSSANDTIGQERDCDAMNVEASSLLRTLQADIRANRQPSGAFALRRDDTSLQIHSCYGELRQVEALRNAILHQLQKDPTLAEEDIVILCPDIHRYAPLIEAGLGPSQDSETEQRNSFGPKLHWRVSDRSLRSEQPILNSLIALLHFANGQTSATDLLELVTLEPVSRKFDFLADDHALIERWITSGRVRWGFDEKQRSSWGLPPGITQGAWEELIDRLLVGLALDDEIELAIGSIAPIEVQTSNSELLGSFVNLLQRLRRFVIESNSPHDMTTWHQILRGAVDEFFATDSDREWQIEQTWRVLQDIRDSSSHIDELDIKQITLRDIIQIVHERIGALGSRSDFFRGGITVTSLLPLRWIPYRVICLLGMDEESLGDSNHFVNSDDLVARNPVLGDREPRAEQRQMLLEAILAASDCCIITHSGRSVKTNHQVPPATVIAELVDVLRQTVDEESQEIFKLRVDQHHARHAFDQKEFLDGLFVPNLPWSFRRSNLEAALSERGNSATQQETGNPQKLDSLDETTVTIERLLEFLKNPMKFYYTRRLQLSFPASLNELDQRLPVELDGLQAWEVATRFIEASFSEIDVQAWRHHEHALGSLPVGQLSDKTLDVIQSTVTSMLQSAFELGYDPSQKEMREISIVLPDGTHLRGTIPLTLGQKHPGTLSATYSLAKDEHYLSAWLQLLALTVTEPDIPWRCVVLRRSGPKVDSLILQSPERSLIENKELAIEALCTVVDLYRRALCEPLPLFSAVSRKIHLGTITADDWYGYEQRGPGFDLETQLAFGSIDVAEMLALPVHDHDPPGPSNWRAQRYANHLWSAVETTAVDGA